MRIKVKATAPGFLDILRKPGDPPFEIEETQFSKKWMERLDVPAEAQELPANDPTQPKKRRGRPPKAQEPAEG